MAYQLRPAVAGAPELVHASTAGRGLAVHPDRARVRGLHEVVHEGRYPLTSGANLLLVGEIGGDVGHPALPAAPAREVGQPVAGAQPHT